MSPLLQRLSIGAAFGVTASTVFRVTQAITLDRSLLRYDCWTWQWCSFSPEWTWVYVSLFPLLALPWFLITDMALVRRYALVMLAVAATAWFCFLTHPTACARPSADGQPAYYATLLVLDLPNNGMPSLHSAFPVVAAWAIARGSRIGRSALLRMILVLWIGLICFSIVALRQHTGTDTIAGLLLGGIGAWALTKKPAREFLQESTDPA